MPIKWIEERSEAYVATIHGRDVVQEIELAATADGKITAVRARLTAAMGAYLQLVTPGIPLLGAWLYGGCYDVEGYDFECAGVFTNTTPTDAYRGAGRPGGDVRDRARGRRARPQARHGSGRAAADELHPRVPGDDRLRPHDRLGRLRRVARPGARDRRLRGAAGRAGRAARARRHEAARHRLLDLRRDVRPRAVADPRRDPVRRRRLGRGHDPLPADRHGAGDDRHLAARAGPRDDVLADRRRPARRRRSRASRCCTATRSVVPLGMDTYGSRSLAVGGVALWQRGREDHREGADDRRAPARGRRGRPRVRRTARSRSPARTGR